MEDYSMQELRRKLQEDAGGNDSIGIQEDTFSGIRRKYEEAELNRKLEGVVFGGYSRKKVNEVINAYREMLSWTQENFEFQLGEVRGEIERLMNERGVLKKQLEEELSKTKEVARMEKQLKKWEEVYEELHEKYETARKRLEDCRPEEAERLKEALKKQEAEMKALSEKYQTECSQLREQFQKAERDLAEMSRRYKGLAEEYEEFISNAQNHQEDTKENRDLVRQMMVQLDSLSQYCLVLEEQHKDLMARLDKKASIEQELEQLKAEHDNYKKALQDCQKKYLETRKKNTELGEAVASANLVVKEVLEQLAKKDEQTERLKRNLKQCKQQMIEAQKEKLDQQTENLEILELLHKLEHESEKGYEYRQMLQVQLEEITKRCTQPETDKIIYLSVPETGEAEEEDDDNRAAQEMIERARILNGRLACLTNNAEGVSSDGEIANAEIS